MIETQTGGQKQLYMSQLDSLRAIAVILVIISHWFSGEHFFNRYTANGTLGVTLFFVLSGFLITGILLKSKSHIEKSGNVAKAFMTFYIRRSLRIFPVYYLLLIVLVFLNSSAIRESFWWHFFYGSNFFFWLKGEFGGHLSHFWSLAVEEQFYLVWPAVIIFVNRKYLPLALVLGIVGAILFRYFITTPQNELGRILMPGSLDSFCLGGLLVYGKQSGAFLYQRYLKKRKLFLTGSFLLLFLVHTVYFKSLSLQLHTALFYFFISVSFAGIIDRVADTIYTPVIAWILNNRALLYIGKISYGIYLFHNFIPYFYGMDLPGIPASLSLYTVQVLRFLLLVGISSLSWFLFEKPVLQLKKRFEY
ncbi:acyltransferase [Lacibacter sp. H375]|uniref:acyltransferase family protein n=1 Tax=Lacibacter sp. H375 TaxID=3133424 RepID=UPI0030C12C25